VESFPEIREPIFVVNHQCFLHEPKILVWLYGRSRRSNIDQALSLLREFYSSNSMQCDLYVFFGGTEAFDFGEDIVVDEFTIGRASRGRGLIDGRYLMPRQLSANHLFVKRTVHEPISFSCEREESSDILLNASSSPCLHVFECSRRISVRPFIQMLITFALIIRRLRWRCSLTGPNHTDPKCSKVTSPRA
jgi:hypothetical protein